MAVLAAAALIAACSSSDDESDDGAAPANDTTPDVEAEGGDVEGGDVEGGDADQPADDAGGSSGEGGLSGDDVGSGLLRIDGEEFTGFQGDCQISRGFGSEDVGALFGPDPYKRIRVGPGDVRARRRWTQPSK